MVICWTLVKSLSAVGFSGGEKVFSSVSFHSKMLGLTNVGLVLRNCLVVAMIVIKIYCKIVQDKYLLIVYNSQYDNLCGFCLLVELLVFSHLFSENFGHGEAPPPF